MLKRIFSVFILLIIILSFATPFCFADGAFVDTVYPYSITFKLGTNIYIVQSKNPIFVNGSLGIVVNGDYKRIALASSSVVETIGTTSNYTALINYTTILESSTDVYNYITREVVFQSEQTDNVVISTQTITDFMTHLTNLTNLSIGIFTLVILIFCYFVSNSIFGLLRKG